MDLPGALNYQEVSNELELSSIIDREWTIVFVSPHLLSSHFTISFFLSPRLSLSSMTRPSNALTGEGIDDGVKWLEEKTKNKS